MDNDRFRRGKLSTHIKYNESTAVLAGNSLLTMAFEILSDKKLMISDNIKINLIKKLSECSGHTGIAGGQFLDLSFENKKIPLKKIIDMATKKTGRLFSFSCMVPAIIKDKDINIIKFFEKIGAEIGLLFQIADDLIDCRGKTIKVGKKTRKDQKQGKATLISLLGYQNTIIYGEKIKSKIINNLKKYGSKSKNVNETLNYILKRNK
jgi:farnesyl diphosphate synthase